MNEFDSWSSPARSHWARLYMALLLITALGMTAHLVADAWLVSEIVDGVMGLAAFATLAWWIGRNRVPLSRLNEPDLTGRRSEEAPSRARPREAAHRAAS